MILNNIYRTSFKFWQKALLFVFIITAILHKYIAHDDASVVPALIPYTAQSIDKDNRLVGPFDAQNITSIYYRHWLGTDALGRDVLAGIIYGSYTALKVGLLSSIVIILIGVTMGFLSGYYGDERIFFRKRHILLLLILFIATLFYSFYTNYIINILLWGFFTFCFLSLHKKRKHLSKDRVNIPIDLLTIKLIEVIRAMPGIFLFLVALSLFKNSSILNLSIVIGLLLWPTITRHLRAEILKLREEEFIISSRSAGQTDWKVFLYHILPLTISPLMTVLAFSFAAAILLESSLSFLGIGVPVDVVTWGSLLREARSFFNAWWLAIFPGLCIYIIIFLFNSIGDRVSDAVHVKSR